MEVLYDVWAFLADALVDLWYEVSLRWGWIGVSIIGLAILRRIVNVIRKVY